MRFLPNCPSILFPKAHNRPEVMATKVWALPQATVRTLSGLSTLTQEGLSTLSLWPRPNWPNSLLPNVNIRPVCVTTAVCSSPHEMCTMRSRLIQNFEGAFSANLDLPKVNTAPARVNWMRNRLVSFEFSKCQLPVGGTSGSSAILKANFPMAFWFFLIQVFLRANFSDFYSWWDASSLWNQKLFSPLLFFKKKHEKLMVVASVSAWFLYVLKGGTQENSWTFLLFRA